MGLLDAFFVSTDKNAHLITYCRFMLPINSMFQSAVGFLGGSDSKESACNVGDLGSIPGLEDPLEKGKTTHFSILAWRIPRTL